jgi:chromosome segregation ATPase
MPETTDERGQRLAERERALADARAALRRERDALAADRAEAKRLLAEARADRRNAERERGRARGLATRFARKLHHALATARAQLDADQRAVAEQTRKLNGTRSEFHAAAAAERDRQRDMWAAVEAHQRRMAAEWEEANRYFAAQSAALDARAAELAAREQAHSEAKAKAQRELAALREEAAGLDVRVRNARQSVEELERQREQLRAEALAPILTAEPLPELQVALDRAADRDLTKWAAELAAREEQLNREKKAVAELSAGISGEKAKLADQRRVLAEQFAQLAAARAKWQEAERATVAEIEDLARTLRAREAELDARHQRLVRADVRRREDAADLWQLRMRLEAWQSKLVAFEMQWHTDRERWETDLTRREQRLQHQQSLLDEAFTRWERERTVERERLRGELARWSADRDRLTAAAEAYDRQRETVLRELADHAARAMAAEQLMGETVRDAKTNRRGRRLAVLRTRWEREFDRRLREVTELRAATASELAALDARLHELQRLLAEASERLAAANARGAAVERAELAIPVAEPLPEFDSPGLPAELAALRDEVERMAGVLLEAELPEPPDPPDSELPWGADEVPMAANADARAPRDADEVPLAEPVDAELLPFDAPARAA